jgi:hypothetical protein
VRHRSLSLALLVTTLVLLVLPPLSVARKTLYTAGFFPLSGEKADIGLGILPAVQLALDDITENDVIPGYKLDLVGNDTMVRSSSHSFPAPLPITSPLARSHFVSKTFSKSWQRLTLLLFIICKSCHF